MTTYTAILEGGRCGETTIEAESVEAAVEQAEEWARSGDYSQDRGEWDGTVAATLSVGGALVESWSIRVAEVRA